MNIFVSHHGLSRVCEGVYACKGLVRAVSITSSAVSRMTRSRIMTTHGRASVLQHHLECWNDDQHIFALVHEVTAGHPCPRQVGRTL
jgi:hypothetical protein